MLDAELGRLGRPDLARPLRELIEVSGDVSVLDKAAKILAGAGSAGLEYLQKIADLLDAYGVSRRDYAFDMGVVRGLDYYTGMVFEIDSPNLGAEKQVGGGGAYNLAEVFGGERIAQTGFALGLDRLVMAAEAERATDRPPVDPNPRSPSGEPRELARYALADGEERRYRTVDSEVREARLAQDPVAAVEDRVDQAEVLVHVLSEFLAATLEDVPRPAGTRLHLLEHPTLLIALEDRRAFRVDVPPDALLHDPVAPVLPGGREAFLAPWGQTRRGGGPP